MSNPFVHVELNTDDVGAAKKFYKKVFNWKLPDMSMGPGKSYTMVDVGKKGTGGGMMQKPMPHAPTMWLPYVEVDDVRKTLARAKKAGGHIIVDYMDVGMGTLGVFADPHGGTIGVWKSTAPPKKATKKKAAKKAKAVKKAAKPAKSKAPKKALKGKSAPKASGAPKAPKASKKKAKK